MLYFPSQFVSTYLNSRILLFFTGVIPIFLMPFWAPSMGLATQIVIFALFGLSFNILFGYTGLLSFGHAAFFGLGAYASALCLKHLDLNVWSSLGIAMVLAAILALIIGFLSLRLSGLAFAFVTLAFAEMIYFIFFHWRSLTGGDDGLTLIPVPKVSIVGIISFGLTNPFARYYFILAVVIIAYVAIYLILNSPFGKVLRGIRENPERTAFLGYNVSLYRLISFILSGSFSGMAGALFALHLNFVPIQSLHWSTSGHVVVLTLIGGSRFFLGPALGSLVIMLIEDWVNIWFEQWELVVGIFFVVVVLFIPIGLAGIFEKLREQFLIKDGLNVLRDVSREKENRKINSL